MKPTKAQQALERIGAAVARDTGKSLSEVGIAEIAAVLKGLNGHGQTAPMAPGQEFLNREVTILLADLRGFTAIAAAHPAGIVIQLLNPCLIKMSEIIFRHQGTIDKFMGDSIMVLFGAPVSAEDDVQRAVACAVEMQMTMHTINIANHSSNMPEMYMGNTRNTRR